MLLTLEHVSKSFAERKVLDDICFTLNHGQTLGLIGPNGAGKSTCVSLICGLLKPEQGQILIDGQTIGAGENTAKQKVGLVPQEIALYDDLSARENLNLFGSLYGLKGNALRARSDHALQLVNLLDRANDKPTTFSGGMKRRLNIAAALLHDPQLLILDEPTVGVDPQSRNAIFESLLELKKQGRALIYTSHYMEEVERLANHLVIIDHGKIIANETPAELYARLPAHAALTVDLALPASNALLIELKNQFSAITQIDAADAGKQLHIALTEHKAALPLLNWLAQQGLHALHFSTAKTKLEDIFLTLTGRSLRD